MCCELSGAGLEAGGGFFKRTSVVFWRASAVVVVVVVVVSSMLPLALDARRFLEGNRDGLEGGIFAFYWNETKGPDVVQSPNFQTMFCCFVPTKKKEHHLAFDQ